MAKLLNLIFAPILAPCTIPLMFTLTSCANSTTDITNFKYTTHDDKTMSIDGLSEKGVSDRISTINIGSSYKIDKKKYKVVEISDYAFYHAQQIRSITLPKTLTRIGSYAFSGLNAPDVSVDNKDNNIDSRVVTFDLSKCNDLAYIGEYAFHRIVVDHLYFPKNNHKLENSGEDAFCGLKFWHDIDFTGFKNLKTFGEWEFYAWENGKTSPNGTRLSDCKVILPKAAPGGCLFTWSDIDKVYWNTDNPNGNTNLKLNPEHMNVFLTSLELHVNVNSKPDVWKTWIEDNAGGEENKISSVTVENDINNDGSIREEGPTFHQHYGEEFNDAMVDNFIETAVEATEELPIIGPILKHILDNGGEYAQMYDSLLDVNGDPTVDGKEIIDTVFPLYKGNEKQGCHMFQCELFLIWDRYLRFDRLPSTN